jgi:8-amino-7-oxononanoate synthase
MRQRQADAIVAIQSAVDHGLMQVTIDSRRGKQVRLRLPNGQVTEVTEFINCSYLGLDVHPDVIAAAKRALDNWGVHLCCARSRFSIGDLTDVESELSALWGGHAVTFPSVTSAHLSALPLVADGTLLGTQRKVRMVFDRFAHASMQQLKPLLEPHARVATIAHNDIPALVAHVDEATQCDEDIVFVADSVYSMGGLCPLSSLLELSTQRGLHLYLDDAHGTSIFGEHGEGAVLAATGGLPARTLITFSLAKGFGCNGGGILLGSRAQEQAVRSFGQSYMFSGPLDFAVAGAARAVVAMHRDGEVKRLQKQLRSQVSLFDRCATRFMPIGDGQNFSPIRMVPMTSIQEAQRIGVALIERGFFVSVAMYPVVPRDQPQLRVCLSASHTDDEIRGLCAALEQLTS